MSLPEVKDIYAFIEKGNPFQCRALSTPVSNLIFEMICANQQRQFYSSRNYIGWLMDQGRYRSLRALAVDLRNLEEGILTRDKKNIINDSLYMARQTMRRLFRKPLKTREQDILASSNGRILYFLSDIRRVVEEMVCEAENTAMMQSHGTQT